MTELPSHLRGVIIQTAAGAMLLPNAAITEVLSFSDPDAIEGAPEWLLGRIRWHGWHVPLIDFARLTGQGSTGATQSGRRRVLVVKALGGNPRMPYLAVLAEGFPRLVTLQAATLEDLAAQEANDECIYARVDVNDEPALVPDLDALESRIAAVAA